MGFVNIPLCQLENKTATLFMIHASFQQSKGIFNIYDNIPSVFIDHFDLAST